jgi:hypothetical protein
VPRPLDRIPPGTVIIDRPPPGWSHLIAKVHSRVGAGDVDQVSDLVADLASFLFSAVVANVESHDKGGQVHYRLTRLAVGIGIRIDGRDIIISKETQKRLGANLDLLHRLGLGRAQDRLNQVLLLAQSDTMAVFDSPSQVFLNGRHQKGVIRHAVLVDEMTGELTTLFWFIARDEEGRYHRAVNFLDWLPPGKVDHCILHIDAREFVLGVITEDAIAWNELPSGPVQFAIPRTVEEIAIQPQFSRQMSQVLEKELREILRQNPDRMREWKNH